MDYNEILKNARECSGPYCKACPVCNGMACRTQVPGPGGKGTAATMLRNYQKWQEVCINMDTICENAPIDTTFTLFGRKFAAPIFAAPVGAMKLHYGDKYDDLTYNDILVSSCAQAGIAAFTGDGTNPAVMEGALHAITAAGGLGVPTVKPWNMETVFAKLDAVRRADPMAVAMDIDAAGLPFLKGLTPPAGSKTVEELRQIVDMAEKPFISPISAPATKERPSPVMMKAPSSASFSTSEMACSKSLTTAEFSAFSASGRLMVAMPMPSFFS